MVLPESSKMSRTEEVHRITENVYKVSDFLCQDSEMKSRNTQCKVILLNCTNVALPRLGYFNE